MFFWEEICATLASQNFFCGRSEVQNECLVVWEVLQCLQQKLVLLKQLSGQYTNSISVVNILEKQHVSALLYDHFLDVRLTVVQILGDENQSQA